MKKIEWMYEKKKINEEEVKDLILQMRKKEIYGVNVTVPYKNKVISHLDKLTSESQCTQSVNTIYLDNNKISLKYLEKYHNYKKLYEGYVNFED